MCVLDENGHVHLFEGNYHQQYMQLRSGELQIEWLCIGCRNPPLNSTAESDEPPPLEVPDQFSQLGVVLTFQDVDGSSTSAAPLRPLFRTQSRIEAYTNPQSGKDHQDL
ncbi:hypothetical protein DPMN_102803 [Dreissena polymorpha]|uniref:Uncharacterized protein n=1 Tax=Dreissena polymorpha TaxID=45954 RepID=A0A9D4RAV2_DREPO|nr:hypothetical protein DPMN_102803 [Dreissena polymorpha]